MFQREKLTKEDIDLLEKTKNKKRIIVVNKIDLENKINLDTVEKVIRISAKNNEGIELLKNEIRNKNPNMRIPYIDKTEELFSLIDKNLQELNNDKDKNIEK